MARVPSAHGEELHDDVLKYARPGAKLDDLRPLIEDKAVHRDVDDLKQDGFYSGIGSQGKWRVPEDMIDEGLARALLTAARISVEAPETMTSAEELRIWVKHLRPVWRRDMASMKRALIACFEEAAAAGVLRGRATPEGMADFVGIYGDPGNGTGSGGAAPV